MHRVSRQVAIVRGFDPIVFGDIHEEDSIVSGETYGTSLFRQPFEFH